MTAIMAHIYGLESARCGSLRLGCGLIAVKNTAKTVFIAAQAQIIGLSHEWEQGCDEKGNAE